jgi:chromosome segregation ATPase
MKKVSTEHLDKIQELNKKQVDIKIALGETQLMQQNVDNRVKELQDSFSEVSKEMQELSEELKEEHGEVQIDVTTGEIVDQPSANVEKDDDKGDS